jgi:UDP-N-acetylmuramate dehydrogenase
MDIKKELSGVRENVSLAEHTSFKIGGKAKYFFTAKTEKDLIEAIITARKLRWPFFILGGGSNLLVSDRGYSGIIIKVQNKALKIKKNNIGFKIIYVEAGVLLSKLVNFSVEKGLTGLEWAAGIPGTFGGAVSGNAGAFGKSMESIIKEVKVLDSKKFKIKKYKNKECYFKYRESVFKKKKNLIIVSAEIKLKKENKEKIKKEVKKNIELRKSKTPTGPSAGSIFKNIEVGEEGKPSSSPTEALAEVKKRAKFSSPFAVAQVAGLGKCGLNLNKLKKQYPDLSKKIKGNKIPTAYFIEKCGLKGKKIKGAEISKKHANFIVNLKDAKAKDVLKLINLVKKSVKNKFKINLEEEIKFL